ncbi:MAG: hypothetical protein OEN23_15410 [Paracoccaceae bacterium]|nr:hypothetical protein [Paracoccaceae bacterium]
MLKRFLSISALAVGVVTLTSIGADAQVACGQRDAVVAKLGEKYGEVRRGGGLTGSTAIFEVWASDATGTWTILKTTPDGLSCVMAVGDGWHDDGGELSKVGDPA